MKSYLLFLFLIINLYAEDNARLLDLCNKNDSKACFELGEIYSLESSPKEKKVEAIKYFSLACDGNNISGCHKLAVIYDLGLSVQKDENKANFFYDKARDINNMTSHIVIDEEDTMPAAASSAAAAYIYDENNVSIFACINDDSFECTRIGDLYSNDNWVGMDKVQAIEFYDRACTGRDSNGCIGAARLYDNDKWEGRDKDKAIQFYKKGCSLGDRKACDLAVTYTDVWEAYDIKSEYVMKKYLAYGVSALDALKFKQDVPSIKPDIAFSLLSLFNVIQAKEIYRQFKS